MRVRRLELDSKKETSRSWTKGMIVNILNPHPYLFWLTVGAPMIAKAASHGILGPSAFIASFYSFLVGSKILLAILVGRSKSILSDHWYIYSMRFLGLALCGFAVVLFHDGLKLLTM
jgi:threonine/homoserine/homoserine lactone efflux protein